MQTHVAEDSRMPEDKNASNTTIQLMLYIATLPQYTTRIAQLGCPILVPVTQHMCAGPQTVDPVTRQEVFWARANKIKQAFVLRSIMFLVTNPEFEIHGEHSETCFVRHVLMFLPINTFSLHSIFVFFPTGSVRTTEFC